MSSLDQLPMFAADAWQMSYGERAALEGIVAQLRPRLAIEIGTATGGSLKRLAAHSDEVHSFDLVAPGAEVAALENVSFHTGDSHELLPQTLAELAAAGRSVDFVLVDGDHTAEGVRRDLEDLLASDAIQRTVIVLHDTTNDLVRRGIDEVRLEKHPKVALVELDCVAGHLSRRDPYRLQLWGGLGLVLVDVPSASGQRDRSVHDDRFYGLASLLRSIRDIMVEIEQSDETLDSKSDAEVEQCLNRSWRSVDNSDEVARLAGELAARDRVMQQMRGSVSWRITAPLRVAKRWAIAQRGR